MGNSVFFNINNQVGDAIIFTTSSSSATTFNPIISLPGSKSARWDFGDGIAQATNSPSYVYSDSGTNKTVLLSVERLNNVNQFSINSNDIIGSLDFSKFESCVSYNINNNPSLTAITFPTTSTYIYGGINALNCDLRSVNLSTMSDLAGSISFGNNANLTALTMPASSTRLFGEITVSGCDLYGRLDFSGYTGGFGGDLSFSYNTNLTGLTFPTNTTNINTFTIISSGLIDPLDLSGLSGFGGNITIAGVSSPFINFPSSTNNINIFSVNGNSNVTEYNISGLTGLGGVVIIQGNASLTGVTLPQSLNSINGLYFSSNPIIKDLDLSPLSGISGNISAPTCSALSGITLPLTNNSISSLEFYDCEFSDYINFTRLTASTNHDINIRLDGNDIPTSGVNHILYDFDNFGWTGGTIWIGGGSNGAPDGSSGGYDGTGATTSLLTKGWTVSTN